MARHRQGRAAAWAVHVAFKEGAYRVHALRSYQEARRLFGAATLAHRAGDVLQVDLFDADGRLCGAVGNSMTLDSYSPPVTAPGGYRWCEVAERLLPA